MRRKVNLDRAGSDFFGVEGGKLRSGWLGIFSEEEGKSRSGWLGISLRRRVN